MSEEEFRRLGYVVHAVFWTLFAGIMAFNAWLVYLIWG